MLNFFLIIAFLFWLLPSDLFAWGPGIHTLITSSLQLGEISGSVAKICMKFHNQFIWGSILADIIIGKNFTNWQYHPHNWDFIFGVFEKAKSDMLRAFMVGYMTHLAQDIIAHNFLIPDFILASSFLTEEKRKRLMGRRPSANIVHFKVESSAEKMVPQDTWRRIRFLQGLPENEDCAEFLESNLKGTRFASPRTSRKIYVKAITISALRSIIRTKISGDPAKGVNSFPIINVYVREARKISADFIKKFEKSKAVEFDPTGIDVIYVAESLARSVRKIAEKKGKENISPLRFFSALREFQPPFMGKRTPVLFMLNES